MIENDGKHITDGAQAELIVFDTREKIWNVLKLQTFANIYKETIPRIAKHGLVVRPRGLVTLASWWNRIKLAKLI